MRRYAENTTTPVASTRAEIRRLLENYGADQFAEMEDRAEGTHSMIVRIKGKYYKFAATRPDPEEFRQIKGSWQTRPLEEMRKKAEQEYMRRWRVLLLLLKAKLEASAGDDTDQEGEATFRREFLPYALVDGNETMADRYLGEIDQFYESGRRPVPLLLPDGR